MSISAGTPPGKEAIRITGHETPFMTVEGNDYEVNKDQKNSNESNICCASRSKVANEFSSAQ